MHCKVFEQIEASSPIEQANFLTNKLVCSEDVMYQFKQTPINISKTNRKI